MLGIPSDLEIEIILYHASKETKEYKITIPAETIPVNNNLTSTSIVNNVEKLLKQLFSKNSKASLAQSKEFYNPIDNQEYVTSKKNSNARIVVVFLGLVLCLLL